MTLLQLIEEIRQHFPEVVRKEIVKDLNKAYKYFCHETRLTVKQADLTITTNTVEYDLLTEFPDLDFIKAIIFKDSEGNPVSKTSELQFTILNKKIKFYDFLGGDLGAIPSEIATITFIYVYQPEDLEDDADEPIIDAKFHDALIYRVLEKYYLTFPTVVRQLPDQSIVKTKDFTSAQAFASKYKELEISGKKEANSIIYPSSNYVGDLF